MLAPRFHRPIRGHDAPVATSPAGRLPPLVRAEIERALDERVVTAGR
jgi:hypothetical protein